MIIRPVILCGGAGTRLWPLSRESFPKQLLPVTGDQSLLQATAERLSGARFARAIVVSSEDQRFFIKRQLEAIAAQAEVILLEPAARNTSAAATFAAAWLRSNGADDLLLLMPSDHVIGDRAAFLQAIETGVPHAENGGIVTFGATPNEPSTQYGYIEAAVDRQSSDGVMPIARFVEKPSVAKAREYLQRGGFYWNAGIFLMKASTLLEEMAQFLPESLKAITSAVMNATRDGLFVRPEPSAFSRVQNISIDHGIMEKTGRGMVLPVDMSWSDVGSWDAVWHIGEKDSSDNVIQGDVVVLDSRGSLLRSDGGPLVAAVGLDKMAVVAVGDAVLVSPIDRVADVKKIVERLKADGRECVISQPKVARHWGSYESIAQGPNFEVKHIIVDPGERLSLQSHEHRSEHWVVVRGSAEVAVGDKLWILQANESTHIPAGTKHRLANAGSEPLEIIEVQSGTYLRKTISRFDDECDRK